MKIREKIKLDYEGLIKNGPINIVAFGDSVTHGAVGSGEIRYDTVYWERLRQKILAVSNYVPVNVINAGIGGINAKESIARMESQVLCHRPDLIIVCFGLNDVNCELEEFLTSLRTILTECVKNCDEVIYMTPNMLNTRVDDATTEPLYREYARKTAEMQNGGRMDLYMKNAVKVAKECGAAVCDCYAEWKKLAETTDTTALLANHINHPTAEMHELFAEALFRTVMPDAVPKTTTESTMYRK